MSVLVCFEEECVEKASETCWKCEKSVCWNHRLTFCYLINSSEGEERYICRWCAEDEFERVEGENWEMEADTRYANSRCDERLRELETQLRRRDLEKEALRRQVVKLGGKPCA